MSTDGLQVVSSFFDLAPKLRSTFEQKFSRPLTATEDRFVWDYWYVENQYKLIRTPAEYFFPADLFQSWVEAMSLWGQQNLGCPGLSQPWLSYYVDGCYQNIHADIPQGPWAYVYALNAEPKPFQGGDTFIAKPNLLDYWWGYSDEVGQERGDLYSYVPVEFNQLTVFDPSYPHGVTPVRGPENPLDGRLVMHGWFTYPEVSIEGVDTEAAATFLNTQFFPKLFSELENYPALVGFMAVEVNTDQQGQVTNVLIKSPSLKSPERELEWIQDAPQFIAEFCQKQSFPQPEDDQATWYLPLRFSAG